MYLLSKTFIKKIDKHRRRFFWAGKKKKRRYYMVKWSKVCRSRNKGGLGVKYLHKQNIALLCNCGEARNSKWTLARYCESKIFSARDSGFDKT
jgi:hypothetical protein